ncbi:MAG: anhydro-N-acetylmuramic acid kinase [Bacteroidetes bacterium]|nr:anhydro-N-acetylmuramic acid kinase [Bacteroidota bacterium]
MIINTNINFAELSAKAVNIFLGDNNLSKLDIIALHGHTVYHFPAQGKTCPDWRWTITADLTGCKVINNFRQADIDAGGQGRHWCQFATNCFFGLSCPLKNIGGISNISFETKNGRIGFDICGANQLLNYIASTVGLEYDENGELAEAGKIDIDLLDALNSSSYFEMPYPKSLDNHFVRKYFIDRIAACDIPVNDKLATATAHIAQQIAAVIIKHKAEINSDYKLLVTGGGAFNGFLIRSIEEAAQIKINLPATEIIQFKESLAMCLMGALRLLNQPNFLPSVTGATVAVSGGEIFLPNTKRN